MNITDLTPEQREKLEEAAKYIWRMYGIGDIPRGYAPFIIELIKQGALSDVAAEIHGMKWISVDNEDYRNYDWVLILFEKRDEGKRVVDLDVPGVIDQCKINRLDLVAIGWMPLPSTNL